jgi:hypothetical protein
MIARVTFAEPNATTLLARWRARNEEGGGGGGGKAACDAGSGGPSRTALCEGHAQREAAAGHARLAQLWAAVAGASEMPEGDGDGDGDAATVRRHHPLGARLERRVAAFLARQGDLASSDLLARALGSGNGGGKGAALEALLRKQVGAHEDA